MVRHHHSLFREGIVSGFLGGSAVGYRVGADRFNSPDDTLLQAIAPRLREILGGSGIVCRTGAEQFGVIVPDTSRLDAAGMAEQARRHVEREPVDMRGSGSDVKAVQVSASFGVAALERQFANIIQEPISPRVIIALPI